MRQIILDTETTGLSPEEGHRVIEIGCLELVNRRLTGEYRHYYLNPERSIERAAEEVHGLTAEFLQDKPKFADIAPELLDFIRDAELVIHNAPFDVGFLNHEFNLWKRHHLPLANYCKILDTLVLAKRKHPGQKNSLDALCRRYHVDNSSRQYHGALLDAELLAQVYLFMTGGQTQLFTEESVELTVASTDLSSPQASVNSSVSSISLPLIEASEAELAAHQEFITKYLN
jgi:DNA polymerase-3 subunit epsilon